MRRDLIFVALVCALLCTSLSGNAQTGNAALGGVVTDSSKALIPGVNIVATETATGVVTSTLTNESGSYNFPALVPGTYKVTAELQGFKTAIDNNVRLGVSAQARVNFALEIGTSSTKVEVNVSGQSLLTDSSASIGEVLTEQRIRDLPTVGNNVLDLLEVLPGFRVSAFGSQFDTITGLGLNSINTTINGLSTTNTRYDAQTYGYDVFTPVTINPDLVGEIKLILSPVDAELGRGNAQVQIQTRSGTNKYTGSAVWNIQNTALNANSWTNNHTGVIGDQGNFIPNNSGWRNTHQITASFGGPIVKNKTFFFALWDQVLTNAREPVNVNVMTDAARQGIFRYWTGWAPGNASVQPPLSYPQNATTATFPSVDLHGSPVAPPFNPDGTPYTGRLQCFSVFGNIKTDGSPFTNLDCPNGTAVTSATPWDTFRPAADVTGYMQRILSLMPRANYFASGDGLNQAQYRYIRGRTGANTANAIVGAVQQTGAAGANSDQTNRKQINIKIDENLNSKHRFNVSWQYQYENSADNVATWPVCDPSGTNCTTSPLNGFVKRTPQVWTVNGTSTLSPNIINEARFGVQHTVTNSQNAFTNPNSGIADEAKSFLLPGGNNTQNGKQYQVVIFPGAGSTLNNANNFLGGPLNVGAEIGNISPLWSWGDTLSWTRNKHAFKFGAELRLPRTNGYNIQALPQVTMGNLGGAATPNVFANAGSPAPITGLVNGAAAGSTNPRTNAVNLLYSLNGSVANDTHQYWIENSDNVKNGVWDDTLTKERRYREQVSTEWDFFVKDDYKVTKGLTLNLGIRYEYYGSPYLRSGLTSAAVNTGDGLFGTGLPSSGNNFSTWGAPGNLFLSNYGSTGVGLPAGAQALTCVKGATQLPGVLPVSTCDLAKTTQIEFVGPKTPNPGKTAIPNRGDFGPAVGFAWQLPWFGEGKTQVRGGFQITYGASSGNGIGLDTLLGSAPGATQTAVSVGSDFNSIYATGRAVDLRDMAILAPVTPTRLPGAAVPVYGRSIAFEAYSPTYVSPYTENFTLSVTRIINPKVTVDVKYVGTIGKKQLGSLSLNTPNVYAKAPDGTFLNKELYDALVATRAGQDAPLFDQMLAGLNLNVGVTCPTPSVVVCYGTIGTVVNGQLQHGSAHLRRNATFAAALANGNFSSVASSLVALAPSAAQGAQAAPIDPATGNAVTGLGQTGLRNGCNRLANGLQNTYAGNGIIPRCFPEDYLTTNPQFSTATYDANLGHSNYQSLQLQGTVRPVTGISFQTTFTWAKNMSLSATSYNNQWLRNADYSQAINTAPYEIRANGTFELPMGPNKLAFGNSSGWFARVVERWQTSIIVNQAAGLPRNVGAFQMQYAANGGNGSQPRPDIVGPWENPKMNPIWGPNDSQGNFVGNPSPYVSFKDPQCANNVGVDSLGFNLQANCTLTGLAKIVPAGTPGAFVSKTDASGNPTEYALALLQNPQPGYQGNLGAYTMHTIGKFQLDANISKTFRVTESKSFQIRVDSKNILNHPLMNDPTGFGNGLSLVDNFGIITGKGGPTRTFQGQVRFSF
jgi:hypothetical protein